MQITKKGRVTRYFIHTILIFLFGIFFIFQSTWCDEEAYYATVLVHGIVSIKPYLTVPNVVKFIRDKIAHTHYARTVEIVRRDPFFYQQQPMGKMGLHKIENRALDFDAANLFVQLCTDIAYHAHDYTPWNYYTFGWSGLLSPRMRHLEAAILYQDLMNEFVPLLDKKKIFLRILCYSHGGNVALKLAELFAQEDDAARQKLRVNQLVLIGIPVLPETDYLINSPLFEEIFHFYSYGDRVQRMDCFSLNRMFSNRIFKERSDFKLPDKLKQIHVGVKRVAKKYSSPQTRTEKNAALQRKGILRTADPGHSELWSFGWITTSYREKFPLYPLPFSVFVPYLIALIQNNNSFSGHLQVELHPSYGCLQIYDYLQKKMMQQDFLSPQLIQHYKQMALDQKPPSFTRKEYTQRITQAKQIARSEWRSERNIRARRKP